MSDPIHIAYENYTAQFVTRLVRFHGHRIFIFKSPLNPAYLTFMPAAFIQSAPQPSPGQWCVWIIAGCGDGKTNITWAYGPTKIKALVAVHGYYCGFLYREGLATFIPRWAREDA